MLSVILAMSLAATVQPQMVVTTDWLATNMDQQNVLILDVTTRDQFVKGHIPGAVLLNSKGLVTRHDNLPNELPTVASLEKLFRDAGVRETDRIIITSSDPLLATRAWFTLDYLGWGEHAALLDGGNTKWTVERRKIDAGMTAPKNGNFTASVNPAAVVTKEEIRTAMASHEPLLLIDARDPKHYLGHQKGAEVKRAGHIPGAQCVPWTGNTVTLKKGVRILAPADQLESMYTKLTENENARIIVYCRSGMEATMNYFVLRYLGLHPSLYDGSYVDWNKTEAVASAD